MRPSIELFFAALVAGLGFGLGWAFITWAFTELVAAIKG